MKIGIDPGHRCPPDTGAEGFLIEQDLNKDVARELSGLLIDAGTQVVNCLPVARVASVDESLKMRCSIANVANCDYFISIHHNAGGGEGTEVYAISPTGKKLAEAVLSSLCGLGFKNRGVKSSKFKVLTATKMPAILVEVCFIDKKSDCDLWSKLGAKKIAKAIFEGLNKALKITDD
jgi:N-acetylmuramoyl-L-alanine amidase